MSGGFKFLFFIFLIPFGRVKKIKSNHENCIKEVREASKKKEFQLGNCHKRWVGVNLKTLFFTVENKEIQVRREGSEPNFLIFVPI